MKNVKRTSLFIEDRSATLGMRAEKARSEAENERAVIEASNSRSITKAQSCDSKIHNTTTTTTTTTATANEAFNTSLSIHSHHE